MSPEIGVLNSGKCYVFLNGYGLHAEPFYGTQEECEAAIAQRDSVKLKTVPRRKVARAYILTFKMLDRVVGWSEESTETVIASDRNEAMRRGRDIARENIGRGVRVKISCGLA